MDEPLISRVICGDTNAINLLIRKYKHRAFAIAIGIVKNHEVAEEVTQDAFLKALKKIESFKGNSKFSTWLFSIVINESLRQFKKKRLDTIEIDTVNDDVLVEQESHLSKIADEQRKRIITKILAQMSSKDCTLLTLYYLEELTVKEIQSITQLGQSDIKTSLYRARQNFSRLAQLNKNQSVNDYVT